MALTRYDTQFEDFLQRIALSATQASLIDDALEEAVAAFMTEYVGDVDIYAQGSYAMGTIIRPLSTSQSKSGRAGEYDIDIVLERSAWLGAVDSLDSVRNVLSDTYGSKLDDRRRESCERVIYKEFPGTEVVFHADYVPIKPFCLGRAVAKRSDNKWEYSDTKKLIEWFRVNYVEQYTFLPALIAIIKRIRDYAELTDDLPSLCITAIVCNNYADTGSYAGDLLRMLEKFIVIFDVPHDRLSITVEPLGGENLAKKISEIAHEKIKVLLVGCLRTLRIAFSDSTHNIDKASDYLSDDFPTDLSKYPDFLESLRSHTFGLELNGLNTRGTLAEVENRGTKTGSRRIKFFTSGEPLLFKASQDYDPDFFSARWQVLNSPQSNDRRGRLFYAQKGGGIRNSNAFTNRETERYEGEHWIRCYIYNILSKKVVEIGEKYYVEVRK